MKRIKIVLLLIIVSGVFTMQSCKKDDNPKITVQNTFSVPVAAAPLDGAYIAPATTTTLSWAATGGAEVKWDLYFSEDEEPALLEENLATQEKVVSVEEGHTYYWQLVNVDARGIKTTSPIFSFTVKVTLNINNFVGAYNVDEGGYLYTVNLTKIDSHTIQSDNFWDNAPSPLWVIQYVFDDLGNVTITPSNYRTTATSSTIYSVSGSGTYDNITGAMSVDYTVTKSVYALQTNGTYTITKTTADANTDEMTRVVPF